MSETATTPCPACGTPGSGNFCSACGAQRGDRHCTGCGARIPAAVNFCTQCGVAQAGRGGRQAEPMGAWAVGATLSVMAVAMVLWAATKRADAQGAAMANAGSVGAAPVGAGGGTPPDLTTMTPLERFTRLNDRIMAAAQQGDTTTVITFWPMARQAYEMLPTADRTVDSRYHMATLHLMVGDTPSTLAQADTIMQEAPDNLLGWYLRAVVADFQGDSAGNRDARDRFDAAFEAQMATGRQEYLDHDPMLRQFLDRSR